MRELFQNAAPGDVRQRGERGIEAGLRILNHLVQYYHMDWRHASRRELDGSAQSLFSACAGRMVSARSVGSQAAAIVAAASAPRTIDGVAMPRPGIRISITD